MARSAANTVVHVSRPESYVFRTRLHWTSAKTRIMSSGKFKRRRAVRRRDGVVALAPNATQISVREVLIKFEAEFAQVARAVENGEFALWVGSGVSRRAPHLGHLVERAFEYVRQRAIDPLTADAYLPALKETIELAGIVPATVEANFPQPLANWPQRDIIIKELWNNYSRVLDIRVPGEATDFILWNAIDIRAAFANPAPPAAQHLCIAILVLEGAVRTVASANWDGFIEAAVARLSNSVPGIIQVVVDPNQMREAPSRAQLLKFHGCVLYATHEPATFRQYLTGSRTQIMEWPDKQLFAAMRNAIINLATNQKTLVLGLSIQDNNLQSVFSRAKQINPWPWPCAPQAPGHVFCEDQITQGQRDVLRIVYGDAYNSHVADIHIGTHLRAWAEQVLIALVLKVIADKLARLMDISLSAVDKILMAGELRTLLMDLCNVVADLAVVDPVETSRTDSTNHGIALWSRVLSIFRSGALPPNPEAYETLSASSPELIGADPNAQAMGLGRFSIMLALLQHGRAAGQWELSPPLAGSVDSGALSAKSSRAGASARPLFLVKSATDAIVLQNSGAFVDDKAIVIHADDTWHRMVGSGVSSRRVRVAPGRTGHVGTTHVSLGDLLRRSDTVAALKEQFVAEMIL